MKKNILELLDDLSKTIVAIIKVIDERDILTESSKDGLSELLQKSVDIIETLENNFEDIENFNIITINKKIDLLMKRISTLLATEEIKISEFNEEEFQLYNDLLDNLHNLSKISIEFEKKHHLGLHTFDKFSVERGLKYMKEGFKLFWNDYNKYKGK